LATVSIWICSICHQSFMIKFFFRIVSVMLKDSSCLLAEINCDNKSWPNVDPHSLIPFPFYPQVLFHSHSILNLWIPFISNFCLNWRKVWFEYLGWNVRYGPFDSALMGKNWTL
jgi:hypothetical protein